MKLSTIWLSLIISALLILLNGCSSSGSSDPVIPPVSYTWSNIGPKGGYVSSVIFHPTRSGEVWASGDDSSGVYKSTDFGATWSLVTGVALNQSTFSFVIDPASPDRFYAPNHYGRGMFKSSDGGRNWDLSQAGLPSSGKLKRLYSLTINPLSNNTLIAATDDGLYRSLDAGINFTKLSVAWGSIFRAAIYGSDGRLYAGASDGTLKYSINNGDSWINIFAGGGIAVEKLALSTNALYIAYQSGDLVYVLLPSFSGAGTINSAATEITTGLTAALAIDSGATQSLDTIYFGTSLKLGVASSRWGLFKSIDGGTNFTQVSGVFAGNSVFTIAIDPQDANNLVVGTVGGGIYHSRNAGSTWVASNSNVYANSALAFAQNPTVPDHMLFSSSIGSGLGKNYETNNGGSTWAEFSHANPNDGESTFDIDPNNSDIILAGTFASGIYRSINGTSGPWTQVLNKPVLIDRFVRESISPQNIYALAVGPNPGINPDATLYYSSDGGGAFVARAATFANDLAIHPLNTGEGVIAGLGDAFASTDFFLTKTSLGLGAFSASEGGSFSATAFDPGDAQTLLVGGSKGGIYKTTNYNSLGAGVSWVKLTTPIQDAVVRRIIIVRRNSKIYYYVATYGADVDFSPTTTAGLYRSSDGGTTWKALADGGLEPSSVFWHFLPYAQSDNKFIGAMWGGGLMHLIDQE